jgi:hypothetical protein
VWLGNHRRIRPPGLFALYVAGYSGFRIFEESLRVDPAHHILGLRLNFYVAALLCVGGIVWFACSQGWRPTWRQARRSGALMLAGGMLALSGCGGSERAEANPKAPNPRTTDRANPRPSPGAWPSAWSR